MKFLACLLIGLVAYQAESRAILEEGVEDKCVELFELDEKEVRDTIQKSDTPEDHGMYGDFYVCVWKGRGVMHENATINSEALSSFLGEIFPKSVQSQKVQEKVINNIIDRCKSVQGETEGQTGIKLKNCMVIVVNELVSSKPEEEEENEEKEEKEEEQE